MVDSNKMSDTSPQGQGSGENPQGNPPVDEKDPIKDPKDDNQPPQVSAEELETLRANSAKWDNYRKRNRANRRSDRQKAKADSEVDDPDLAEAIKVRDSQISTLSSENFNLKTGQKISELLSGEEYKDIPRAVKVAIKNNPLGFVKPNSETVEDAVYDIQDYLDDVLDSSAGDTAPKADSPQEGKIEVKIEEKEQTPPINNSGPEAPKNDQEIDITGKTGKERSVGILQNLIKGIKKQ